MVLAVMVLWAVAIVPARQLDDLVAHRPVAGLPRSPPPGQGAALES